MTKRKVNSSIAGRVYDVGSISGIKEWKFRISKALWEFVKNGFPSKRRVTGADFWIDRDSLVNAIILNGYAFPAADIKNFSAPVDKRTGTRRHAFYTSAYGWRMTDHRAVTGRLGVFQRDTEYYGGRKIDESLGFFGVKRQGKVTAYGLDDEGALPAFSYDVCLWLFETQQAEVQRIIDETFLEVFGVERKSA
jgi:hypothetical protein